MAEKKRKTLERLFAEEADGPAPPEWDTYQPGDGSQNATASIGHWHDFNGAGPAYEPGVLQEEIDANTAAIEANRVLIDQNTVDTQNDHLQINENTEAIAENTYEIGLLANRVADIEAFLGGVTITIPLGTGRWIFDSTLPPTSSHFTAFQQAFNEAQTQFWFNESDKQLSSLQWGKARQGDRLTVTQDNLNHGTFTVIAMTYEDAVYYFEVAFDSGAGKLSYGQSYECGLTRSTQQFTPPEDPE